MKKVKAISPGSTIAVVSPSWGGPSCFPWVYDLGIKRLKEEFGFKIKEYPTTRGNASDNQKHPEKRAEDLISAFQDRDVNGIISSIGGDDAVRLLEYLDKSNIPPKFFMGYSDSTVLLAYFYEKGFCTFHGPAVMAGFAEPGKLSDEFFKHLKDFMANGQKTYSYHPYKRWTEEQMSWNEQTSLDKTRNYQENSGWRLLEDTDNTEVSGILWGGCLEALEFIKGTKYWPKTQSFWNDKIIFFEISDEKLGIEQVKWMLRNYGVQGVFGKIRALLFGRFAKVAAEEEVQLEKMISDTIYREFASSIPVIMNMDFGHTYPQQIMPLGTKGLIKIHNNNISFSIETPFV